MKNEKLTLIFWKSLGNVNISKTRNWFNRNSSVLVRRTRRSVTTKVTPVFFTGSDLKIKGPQNGK